VSQEPATSTDSSVQQWMLCCRYHQ